VWQCLFKSKVSYAAEILCFESKEYLDWLKSFSYKAFKSLLGIKNTIGRDRLLEVATGHKWECWLSEKLKLTRNRLKLRKDVGNLCDCEDIDAHKHIDPT
jgi:hypothetical protein